MAATNLKRVGSLYLGVGAPEEGDPLVENILMYPMETAYLDRVTGKAYVRSALAGTASDYSTPQDAGAPTTVTMLQLTAPLTDAQIKAATGTYPELVPAPGAGKMIYVHGFNIRKNIVTGYTNIGNPTIDQSQFASVNIGYDGEWYIDIGFLSNHDPFTNTDTQGVQDLLSEVGDKLYVGPRIDRNVFNVADVENKGLYLFIENSLGNITGGDPANTIEVTVFYSIVDL